MIRPTSDETLMRVAMAFEERSTCSRNHVGAVIAREGRIISTGYNGAPAGMPHCNHPTSPPSVVLTNALTTARTSGCTIAIHAEANAISYAARHGVGIEGADLYTTLSPCFPCSQLIIAAGLRRVVYGRPYRDRSGLDLLSKAIIVEKWLS